MAWGVQTLRQWLTGRPQPPIYNEIVPWGSGNPWADTGYLPGTQYWWPDSGVSELMQQSPSYLWRTQPYLRTVVDFMARNIAQLGLQVFNRVTENDRVRLRDGPMAALVTRPNPEQTSYEVILALVSDLALHDNAYWLIGLDQTSRWQLVPIPAEWIVDTEGDNGFSVTGYYFQKPGGARTFIPASEMIHFHGWDPVRPAWGSSPVQTLKLILAEQMEAESYRQQVWKRGGRVGAVLERPVNAPKWSDTASEQFRSDWMSTWTGRDGPKAGGTPILEDGMQLKRIGFSAHEDQFVEASKLNLNTVAAVYHINPTMIGLLDNANYSNVREFRRMLYGDTLGPVLAQIEARINTFLLPMIGEGPDTYVEFNVAEKLQGSFEEQASVMSTMVGRPIMTANEGRARFNLPAVQDSSADELITPLNVTVGGQPSPQTPTETPSGSSSFHRPIRLLPGGKRADQDSHGAVEGGG